MNVQEKLSELSMKIADNIRAHNELINEFDAIEKAVKEMQQQPVTTNWYDFTEEQQQHLGEIVNNFIYKVVGDLGRTDVHFRDNGIEVSVEVDLQELVEDELPYGLNDKFIDFLNDEITEQREEQQ